MTATYDRLREVGFPLRRLSDHEVDAIAARFATETVAVFRARQWGNVAPDRFGEVRYGENPPTEAQLALLLRRLLTSLANEQGSSVEGRLRLELDRTGRLSVLVEVAAADVVDWPVVNEMHAQELGAT